MAKGLCLLGIQHSGVAMSIGDHLAVHTRRNPSHLALSFPKFPSPSFK
jgi:hypothetical protein